MISYIIIDDEPIAHRIIEGYCEHLPQLKKAGNCFNAFEAMQLLNEQQIDLLFLDINMPRLSGLSFIKTLSNPPEIIITTAYKDHALEGYELNVCDYLLKPFSFERFMKAINKVSINIASLSKNGTSTPDDISLKRIFLKGNKRHHQIDIDHILFIEACGNYSKVVLLNESIVCHEKISTLEHMLPSKKFLRVHKSFLVALDHIDIIEGNRILIKQHKIPVGQTYKAAINHLIKH
ncbi:LytR/AlgR family response regulator transcription factor [Zhouia amylolytica]|uniref:Two-component response regulator n=1 Tax=Zhouia amylolytica AD3 TaxID=1286632 RepID=W2UPU8_9FLAO|nr:response regulator transcription factor [Zhouia amylolytica]ETN95516.1 two-component response regulator [Zhouia amylolytica AD3]MCQ0110709.1 response regulator transcription factor [Zhouia amylolytica]